MSLTLEADSVSLPIGPPDFDEPRIIVERSGGWNSIYQAHFDTYPSIVVGGTTPEEAQESLVRVHRMRQREEREARRARIEALRTTAYDRVYPPKEQS